MSHNYLSLVCLILMSGTYAFDDDEQSVFMAVQLEVTNELPADCLNQIQLPGKAISGQNVNWTYLCSGQLLDDCSEVIQYTFRMEFTEDEIDLVRTVIDALTITGANHICSLNQTTINDVMVNGGKSCIVSSEKELNYCSYVSILKFTTGNDPESLCKTLDYSYECAMSAINHCQVNQLEDLWSDYFRRILKDTVCERFTKYKFQANTAIRHTTTNQLWNLGLVIILISIW